MQGFEIEALSLLDAVVGEDRLELDPRSEPVS